MISRYVYAFDQIMTCLPLGTCGIITPSSTTVPSCLIITTTSFSGSTTTTGSGGGFLVADTTMTIIKTKITTMAMHFQSHAHYQNSNHLPVLSSHLPNILGCMAILILHWMDRNIRDGIILSHLLYGNIL